MIDLAPATGEREGAHSNLRALARYRAERGNVLFGVFLAADDGGDDGAGEATAWLEEGMRCRPRGA